MPRVVLDTNVLLDFFDSTRTEHDLVVKLMSELVTNRHEICIVATSLKDIYYILTRQLDEATARRCVTVILETTTLLSVDPFICRQAVASHEPDFEDGIIEACAHRSQADYIVTRDKDAFAHSPQAKIAPVDLLQRLNSTTS